AEPLRVPVMEVELDALGVIERTHREVDEAGDVARREGDRCATARAEAALRLGRRGVGGGLARREAHVSLLEEHPGHRWRRAGAPAHRTVAQGRHQGSALRCVTYGAALAPAFELIHRELHKTRFRAVE